MSQEATLRLFNAIQVESKGNGEASQKKHSFFERTIPFGYILDPTIESSVDEKTLKIIEATVGISAEQANAAFHKSWKTIQEKSIETLVCQQLLHYLTTYGFEALGVYNADTVYIPNEKLEIPELQDDVPLRVIKAMDASDILEGIIQLASGAALSERVLQDIMTIIQVNSFESNQLVMDIQNRELKARLYKYYDIVPDEPVEYLRHLIGKLTGESLVIKNDALIQKLKAADRRVLDPLLDHAPKDLASIFLRYKPLFLAMKSISRKKTFFNQLRKKAVTMHKALTEDYLNNVTTQLKRGILDPGALNIFLDRASIFRKIRLAYALQHRLNSSSQSDESSSIVYKVRNGRGWATEFDWPTNLQESTQQALGVVRDSIIRTLRENVEGLTVVIPPNIQYALPATEKQFTGNLPTGTYVTVSQDLIFGIHWCNDPESGRRVDMDLSAISISGKTGWDGQYRSDENKLLFSGDVTDAPEPNGATELFYIKKGITEPQVLMVNYYNFKNDVPVPVKLLVAKESPDTFGANYMINPANMICSAEILITQKQSILGLVTNVEGENRVYFANVSIGNSISADAGSPVATHSLNYLYDSLVGGSLDLGDILGEAGALVVEEKPEGIEDVVDLSPTSLQKSTVISLMNASDQSDAKKRKRVE